MDNYALMLEKHILSGRTYTTNNLKHILYNFAQLHNSLHQSDSVDMLLFSCYEMFRPKSGMWYFFLRERLFRNKILTLQFENAVGHKAAISCSVNGKCKTRIMTVFFLFQQFDRNVIHIIYSHPEFHILPGFTSKNKINFGIRYAFDVFQTLSLYLK